MTTEVKRVKRLFERSERFLPPGFSGSKELGLVVYTVVAAMAMHILGFIAQYTAAHGKMYENVDGKRVEIAGAVFAGFDELLTLGRLCMLILLLLAVWTLVRYISYHYTGPSRCIYTMRRLSSRREYWRRCCAIPAAWLVLGYAAWVVTTVLLGAVYALATPERWMISDPWSTVARAALLIW